MARTLRVTPEMGEIITQLRTQTSNVSALHRALKARGVEINRRTLDRYLAAGGAYASAPRPTATPKPAEPSHYVTSAAAEGAAALAGDADLEELERVAAVVKRAMRQWESQIGREPTAVRAYRALAETYATLRARCAELRPRESAEREAVLVEGSAEREALIARARAAARADDSIRGKYERARTLLERKFGESAP